jgi:hypothetical protein
LADKVDLALILAIDGSASVTYDEFGLIAGGLAASLRDPEITQGLIAGNGVLLSLLLWSGQTDQDVLVDWTRVTSPSELGAFADQVENMPRSVPPGLTAIGAALAIATALLARAPVPAARQIIDIAGDGRNNDGPNPAPIRDRLVEAGVTINGLCVLHEEPDLLDSYNREVIGGPGHFALVCPDYAGFAAAMREKLRQEAVS